MYIIDFYHKYCRYRYVASTENEENFQICIFPNFHHRTAVQSLRSAEGKNIFSSTRCSKKTKLEKKNWYGYSQHHWTTSTFASKTLIYFLKKHYTTTIFDKFFSIFSKYIHACGRAFFIISTTLDFEKKRRKVMKWLSWSANTVNEQRQENGKNSCSNSFLTAINSYERLDTPIISGRLHSHWDRSRNTGLYVTNLHPKWVGNLFLALSFKTLNIERRNIEFFCKHRSGTVNLVNSVISNGNIVCNIAVDAIFLQVFCRNLIDATYFRTRRLCTVYIIHLWW